MADANLTLGSCVSVFGAVFSLTSYLLIGSVPLTAMGIGLVIVGIAWALTPPNPLPREVVKNLVRSSCSNIEVLLEALGANEKAVYVPVKDGREVVAYVPIRKAGALTLEDIAKSEGRIVVNRGGSFGVIVTPPKVSLSNPHPSAESLDVHSMLEHVLVESEVATSVKSVAKGNMIIVEVKGLRIDINYPRFRNVMGSLPSSIAAQAVALAASKPAQVTLEKRDKNRLIIHVRVLDWTDRSCT